MMHESEGNGLRSKLFQEAMHKSEGHGFRSQLLREVGQERKQCLALAEAAVRQRAALMNCSGVDVTVTVSKNEIRASSALGKEDCALHKQATDQNMAKSVCLPKRTPGLSGGPASVPGHGALGWNAEDDIAQADALKALRHIGERSRHTNELEVMLKESSLQKEAKEETCALKKQVASLQEALAKEWEQQAFMSQQMLCLEKELDSKEATITELESDLERKEEQLCQMPKCNKRDVGDYDARIKSLELQLRDRDQQLEAKDGHIMRLLSVLRQHRSNFLDDALDHPPLSHDGIIKVCC